MYQVQKNEKESRKKREKRTSMRELSTIRGAALPGHTLTHETKSNAGFARDFVVYKLRQDGNNKIMWKITR